MKITNITITPDRALNALLPHPSHLYQDRHQLQHPDRALDLRETLQQSKAPAQRARHGLGERPEPLLHTRLDLNDET